MKILDVKNITVSYERVLAVRDVSFSVESGEYICIVGANGSGKSTLVKAIMGLVPITSGKAEKSLPADKISYLQQVSPIDRRFPATVREIVLSGTQKKGGHTAFYSAEDKKAAQQAIDTMKINDICGKRIGHLSGGQQQRVMIARALCRQPELLLLDEPCAGLDAEITAEIYSLLKQKNKEGMTIIMVSHDIKEVRNYASRVMVMSEHLEFDGTAREWEEQRGCSCG